MIKKEIKQNNEKVIIRGNVNEGTMIFIVKKLFKLYRKWDQSYIKNLQMQNKSSDDP